MPNGPPTSKAPGGEPAAPPSTPRRPLCVHVAVDRRRSREAIAQTLFSTPGINVHCSACGVEGAAVAARVRPDVVVVGASRNLSAKSAVALFRTAAPAAKVVLLRRPEVAGTADGDADTVVDDSPGPHPIVDAVLAAAGRRPGPPES